MGKETEYDEQRATGMTGIKIYKMFFTFGLKPLFSVLVISLFVLSQASTTTANYWLAYWFLNTLYVLINEMV